MFYLKTQLTRHFTSGCPKTKYCEIISLLKKNGFNSGEFIHINKLSSKNFPYYLLPDRDTDFLTLPTLARICIMSDHTNPLNTCQCIVSVPTCQLMSSKDFVKFLP